MWSVIKHDEIIAYHYATFITFSASSSFHDPMIKSDVSFFIPVDPFILAPPFKELFTSDCSFRNVGEFSCPPEILIGKGEMKMRGKLGPRILFHDKSLE